jgi:prepilin-type N-terminal cleavage/methylation domain-containing protein
MFRKYRVKNITNAPSVGFTLIELLIVIVVISLIATAAFAALNPTKRIGDSNDGRRKADLISLSKAIELYTADYGYAPTQLASNAIASGQKYVLCTSAATLTCGGQSNPCLVVSDSNFLGTYLSTLPIDPSKSATTDTGYYITRSNTNSLVLGACSSYNTSAPVQIASRVNLPAYVPSAICGNQIIEGSEVCDSARTLVCENNGAYFTAGYVEDGATCVGKAACNASCTACITPTACCGHPLPCVSPSPP